MKNKCLIFGAGSIGKSVAGYVFNRLGCDIAFVDVSCPIIDDINKRKFYRILQSESEVGTIQIDNVKAVNLKDREAIDGLICDVDYICTAVGMKGINQVLKVLSDGIHKRYSSGNLYPLYIILCENNLNICSYAMDELKKHLKPEELNQVHLIDTSIERITKQKTNNESEYDVIGEKFYPIIISKDKANNSQIFIKNPELFMPVNNLKAYYYRKLYTNNLGHAVLGYIGYSRGYKNIIQCIEDIEINSILRHALKEAGTMLIIKFGFTNKEMDKHLEELIIRYSNKGLSDSVERVVREPIRKLSRYERLIGPANLCLENDIYPEAIIKTIYYAINHKNTDDEQSVTLFSMLADRGIDYLLKEICGLDHNEKLYGELVKLHNSCIEQI